MPLIRSKARVFGSARDSIVRWPLHPRHDTSVETIVSIPCWVTFACNHDRMGAEREHLAGFYLFLSRATRARPYRNGASHGNAARHSRCADVTEWFEVISHSLAQWHPSIRMFFVSSTYRPPGDALWTRFYCLGGFDAACRQWWDLEAQELNGRGHSYSDFPAHNPTHRDWCLARLRRILGVPAAL